MKCNGDISSFEESWLKVSDALRLLQGVGCISILSLLLALNARDSACSAKADAASGGGKSANPIKLALIQTWKSESIKNRKERVNLT